MMDDGETVLMEWGVHEPKVMHVIHVTMATALTWDPWECPSV